MRYSITKEFTMPSLVGFALPTVVMMIFSSLYTVVDGIFVSRFIGTDALSALNIVFPLTNVALGLGIMLGTGGSAVVARRMGEGRGRAARENFSLIVLFGFLAGTLFAVVGTSHIDPLIRFLGSSERLTPLCREYLRVLLWFMPLQILQVIFQSFFVTAGRPDLGLFLTVLAGLANAALDYLFIVPLGMGIAGAAWATVIGYSIPATAGILYFMRPRGELYFAPPRPDNYALLQSCFNGSSEMVSTLASSIVTFLFNGIMMRYFGEDGVAAITIVLYAQFLFSALFLGFSSGVAPIISFNFGSGNTSRLSRIYRICLKIIAVSSAGIFLASLLLASPVVAVFSPRGTAAYDIAMRGFVLFSTSYLFTGVNIFASSLFTALSDGKVSAIISFMRTFVFILLLPLFMEVNGIWLAVPFAEFFALMLSLRFLTAKRRVYRYA